MAQSKLEAARAAIAELKKAEAAGEDVTQAVTDLTKDLDSAQSSALLKAVQELTKSVADLKAKDEEKCDEPVAKARTIDRQVAKAEDKEEEKEDELPPEDGDEKKSSVLLDLALEEIVRLKNGGIAKAEDDKGKEGEYPYPDKEDEGKEGKEVEKAEGASEPGPTGKLEKPASTDYADSAEKKGGGTVTDPGGKKVVISKAELDDLVTRQASAVATKIMKQAGYTASGLPITPIVGDNRAVNVGGQDADLVKAWDKFCSQPWKTINRFRMEVDPSLKNLGQPNWYTGQDGGLI